jgi:hypothetical protein
MFILKMSFRSTKTAYNFLKYAFIGNHRAPAVKIKFWGHFGRLIAYFT